ncbi:MAG: GNAT family N-acetyltransferase, partial [Anaeroplasmataceae bacterium]|nr:GNAT family N-acetyltransferase [Anaeroplasmataceae bacterium]
IKMDISCISKKYQVRKITEKNIPEVLELCLGNPNYYKHCPPMVTYESISEDLKNLPPRKTLKDKYYVGFYDEEQLVAVMDLILEYPNDQTIFIGFFMMHKMLQGKGIGSRIIQEVLECFMSSYTYVRLGYILGNKESEGFWLKNHFQPTGVVVKQETYSIVVVERKLEE